MPQYLAPTKDNLEHTLVDMGLDDSSISCGVREFSGFSYLRVVPGDEGFLFSPKDKDTVWNYVWDEFFRRHYTPLSRDLYKGCTVIFSDKLTRDPYSAHGFVKWVKKNKSQYVRIQATPVTYNPNSGNCIRTYVMTFLCHLPGRSKR